MIIIVTTFWPAFIEILHLPPIDRIGPYTRRPLLEVVRHSWLLQGRQLLIVSLENTRFQTRRLHSVQNLLLRATVVSQAPATSHGDSGVSSGQAGLQRELV